MARLSLQSACLRTESRRGRAAVGSLGFAMTPDNDVALPLTRRERLIELLLVVAMIYFTIALMGP
jgi:hypothetical protein